MHAHTHTHTHAHTGKPTDTNKNWHADRQRHKWNTLVRLVNQILDFSFTTWERESHRAPTTWILTPTFLFFPPEHRRRQVIIFSDVFLHGSSFLSPKTNTFFLRFSTEVYDICSALKPNALQLPSPCSHDCEAARRPGGGRGGRGGRGEWSVFKWGQTEERRDTWCSLSSSSSHLIQFHLILNFGGSCARYRLHPEDSDS